MMSKTTIFRLKDANRVETPKGTHYKIRLADGSMVWLNAAIQASISLLL